MAGGAFPAVVALSLLGAATFFVGSASASWHAQVLIVGGEPRGWSKPMTPNEESYNHWATRNRFHVGDILHFKYAKNDSVLVVTRDAYQLCIVDKPTMHFEGGDTRFRLDRNGVYYFISGGTAGNCDAGQRMTLRVLEPPQQQPDAPAPAPAPTDAVSPAGGEDEGGSYEPPPGARRHPSPPGSGGTGSASPGSGSGSGSVGGAVSKPPPPAVGANGNKTSAPGSTHKSSSPSLRGHRVLAVALVALLLLVFLPA